MPAVVLHSKLTGWETLVPPIRLVPQKLKNGAEYTLSSMRVLDRLDRAYRGPIEPQERIDDEAALFTRAIAWVTTGK